MTLMPRTVARLLPTTPLMGKVDEPGEGDATAGVATDFALVI